jgi:hypothetical protein
MRDIVNGARRNAIGSSQTLAGLTQQFAFILTATAATVSRVLSVFLFYIQVLLIGSGLADLNFYDDAVNSCLHQGLVPRTSVSKIGHLCHCNSCQG